MGKVEISVTIIWAAGHPKELQATWFWRIDCASYVVLYPVVVLYLKNTEDVDLLLLRM